MTFMMTGSTGDDGGGLLVKAADFKRRNPMMFFVLSLACLGGLVYAGTFISEDQGSDEPSVSGSAHKSSDRRTETSSRPRPPTDAEPSGEEAVISWEDAADFDGQKATVEGTIVRVAMPPEGKTLFLYFSAEPGRFAAKIYNNFMKNFPADVKTAYINKRVRVTGKIGTVRSRNAPEMILYSSKNIEVVSTAAPEKSSDKKED